MTKRRLVGGSIFKNSTGLTIMEAKDGNLVSGAAEKNNWHGKEGGVKEFNYEGKKEEIISEESYLSFRATAADYTNEMDESDKRGNIIKTHIVVRQFAVGNLELYSKTTQGDGTISEKLIDTYRAVSGPGLNGLIPDSPLDGYVYGKPVITPANVEARFLYETNDKFSFKMRMIPDRVGGREALLIHSTKKYYITNKQTKYNNPVLEGSTDGCIGLCGGPEESHRFYDKMVNYFGEGHSIIKVKVKIDKNANTKTQLKFKAHY